jgi:hypothetical protein
VERLIFGGGGQLNKLGNGPVHRLRRDLTEELTTGQHHEQDVASTPGQEHLAVPADRGQVTTLRQVPQQQIC